MASRIVRESTQNANFQLRKLSFTQYLENHQSTGCRFGRVLDLNYVIN